MASSDIEQAIQLLSKLPALGQRSSRRALLHLLSKRETHFSPLIAALQQVYLTIQTCPVCGNMDTTVPCAICADDRRSKTQICVVQDVADLWALERAGVFKGTYHVLGGLLNALDGIGPDELKIVPLIQKIEQDAVTEIILALPATIEGQTTAHYLSDRLAGLNVKISSLSRGVPVGGELDYLDDGTLQMAFKSRREVL